MLDGVCPECFGVSRHCTNLSAAIFSSKSVKWVD